MSDSDAKDYIINLRVSRATYNKIKEKAKENSETISNLVRKAIDDSSEIISDLSKDIFGKNRKKDFDDIASYHKVKAAKEISCDNCGAKIRAGEAATLGETRSGRGYYFCAKCRN